MSSSVLALLRRLMASEAPAQTEAVREALRRSARTGKEHSVVGASDKPVGGNVVEGEAYTVMPSFSDRSAALASGRPVLDMHTHPMGSMGVRPSLEDFAYYRDRYGPQVRSGPVARELRSLIVQPPDRGQRAGASYNFFATDKPLAVFDPRRIEDARYELQRAAARGKFRSIMDDPAFRDYFEHGGDIADLMEEAASLMLLRRRAEQGLGRHELQLGNRLITPDPTATERRLFEMMSPEALETLRAKKMATGGAVRSGDEMSEEEYLARLQQMRPRSGRRPEALNQSRGVNMPLQLARGWAAGTAGLPGDIESLLRMVPLPTRGGAARAAEQTVLPTSEEILPRIPGEDTSPAGRLFSGMGTLAGGAGVTKIARGVNRAADVAGNKMVQAITGNPQATAVGVLQEAGQMSPLAAIVKPKGGNWLAGHTDYALAPLRRSNAPTLSGDIVNEAAGRDLFSEYRKVYEQDPTIGLHDWMRTTHPDVYAKIQNPEDRAINRWIDTKLDKYIRNDMGTPEDPVRALAERDILHVSPTELNYRLQAHGKYPTETQQFMAGSDTAKVWEGASDNAINVAKAEDYLKYMGDAEYDRTIKQNPWLMKVPPETRIYGTAEAETLVDDLGFNHLIDELKDAMNPETTLPRNLRLDPKDIDKLTMAQAVERVSKINAWRAEEAAKAEKAGMMANLQATPRLADDSLQLSFVDKPGGAWVDIPETIDDKGMKLCNSIGKAGGWCTQAEWAAKSYGSGENRLTALVDAEGRPHAQAKVTSKPLTWDHITEKVGPDEAARLWNEFDAAIGERSTHTLREFDDFVASKGLAPAPNITELKPPGNSFESDRAQEYIRRDPQYKDKVTDSVLNFLNSGQWGKVEDLHHYGISDLRQFPEVQDLFGKRFVGNKEVLSMVDRARDFIETSPTLERERQARAAADNFRGDRASEEYHNLNRISGELVHQKIPYTYRELRGMLNDPAAYSYGPNYTPSDVLADTILRIEQLRKLHSQNPPGFSKGGSVNFDPDDIAQMAGKFTDQFTPGYAAGGLVKYDPAEIDTIVSEMKEAFHG